MPSRGEGMRREFIYGLELSWHMGKEEGPRHTRYVVKKRLCEEVMCGKGQLAAGTFMGGRKTHVGGPREEGW